MRGHLVVGVVLSVALLACPPEDKKQPASKEPVACARVGQNCEVSPGKLGTCVVKDGCTEGPGCYVCQSQH